MEENANKTLKGQNENLKLRQKNPKIKLEHKLGNKMRMERQRLRTGVVKQTN